LEDKTLSTSGAERRAHRRIDTTIEVQGTPEEGGVAARMVASNLSAGGLYCTSSADFPEMTRLAVRLELPTNGDPAGDYRALDIEAVVVRREEVRSSSGAPRYRLGLFFTRVDDDAREHLSRFVGSRDTGPVYH
jgi:c-di-GMP-binding flagellar brake protein YcgR